MLKLIVKYFKIFMLVAMLNFTFVMLDMESASAAATAPLKVMPLGDSITEGYVVSGGYRTQLWTDISSAGLSSNVDLVGSVSTGPSTLGDKDNEGHPGWSIAGGGNVDSFMSRGIALQVDTWMSTYNPDIVMLQIGTNDILHSCDMTTAPDRLSSLIDKICAKLPSNGKLYVATITPLKDPTYNSEVIAFNATIPGIIASKVSDGKPVYLVNMNGVITADELRDGIHPSQEAYNKMGDFWFNAIKGDLTEGLTSNTTLSIPEAATPATPVASAATVKATTTGWILNQDKTWSYILGDGTKKTGWLNSNGNWYYFKPDGIMAKGWVNDNGNWYYCDPSSGAMKFNVTIEGYTLGSDGSWIK
jgi:lysophospholipase L1-like esterase